ncbi:MAG TPA: di-heme oxidoredictase family protein [Terriglobales bacterium]|nr:di-heme oxidoredictase family protein [Terriglobales bacterium]
MFRILSILVVCVTAISFSAGQKDPGPRGGAAGAGGPYVGLNSNEQTAFSNAAAEFSEVDSVSGTIAGENGKGLGPTFNGNSCAQCHAEPAAGGSSPGLSSPQHPIPNPQVILANLDGADNTVPSFITRNGPIREARFVRILNQRGTPPDGGVHDLYTIAGRSDALGCNLGQPDFNTQLANNNVIFRIPTPIFGLGLVEATLDSVLQSNLSANASTKARLGIGGRLNTSANDGTVTRFGWKAQNKSLLVFAGEAYNVEQGVSNEAFPNERSAVSGCAFNGSPEDATNMLNSVGSSTGTAVEMSSDVVNFALFMRLSAPPAPAPLTTSAQNGATLFNAIGCALCHTATLTTGPSRFTGMSNVSYHPYSDFALHHMGSGLADGIVQGAAGSDQFRTAPLWGVGQRLFFMHDGRTSDLLRAIRAHSSSGSEANAVVNNFNSLSATQIQNILIFLRSL